jgi:hypothetical protein
MAQGNAMIPRMRHPASGDNTGAGPVPIGDTVPTGSMSDKWHPTVLTLLAILAVEVAGFAALRYTFAKL